MKIIFYGTPEFAVDSLDILVQNHYEIVAVVTVPDKPAGRGLVMKESAVKKYAVSKGLKILQPVKLNDPEFLDTIRNLKPDLQIVVAFRMMPEALWRMSPKGTFNLHGSLLPQYRGAAPINRAVMNGETETGVTTFFLKHEIDTGNILFSEKVAVGQDETAGDIHDKLKVIGAQLVLKTVQAIESNSYQEIPQENLVGQTEIKKAPKIFSPDCKIDWNSPAQKIHNQVRGLSPFPGAFTNLGDASGNKMVLKIYRTAESGIKSQNTPGTITIRENKLYFSTSTNLLEVIELQQEGKKRMSAQDFIKGFRSEKQWTSVN